MLENYDPEYHFLKFWLCAQFISFAIPKEMEFSQPPPEMSNSGNQFNNFSVPPPVQSNHHRPGGYHAGKPGQPFFRPFVNFNRGPGALPMTQDDFDGKRLRKSVMRKTVDYNAAIIRALEVSITCDCVGCIHNNYQAPNLNSILCIMFKESHLAKGLSW